MEDKNITIDGLARMVQKGFGDTAKRNEVNERFNKVENRLERIENLLIVDHRTRIEKLEVAVKQLKELLAVE